MIQPWEYGHLPCDWVAGAREKADEVWVHSRFVRDLYVRSGVPAEKVRIIPLGFDQDLFQPDGPVYPVPTRRGARFLFVGGAIHRKGADLLLAAYQRAFTPKDDVCLVVKDMGTRTFYQGMTYRDLFCRAQADPQSPEVVYLDADVSDPELAALYRACTCVVLPYRAEGFALPPLEGMGCGLPAIVTSGGPTDDYLDDTMALRVPHRRRLTGGNRLGDLVCAGDPWQLEPDLDALVEALRWVRDHPEAARERGARARVHALASWTWGHAVYVARARLGELVAPAPETPLAPAALWGEPTPARAAGEAPALRGAAPEISLCVIARDEECRIGDCLGSVAPFVDEMVVVDTGSRDRSREVALKCGARVFDFPWVDCFATARNESLQQARGRWILWMDADDTISSECGGQLRELVRQHPNRDAAFQVQVRIPPGPGEFSESIVDHIKLFPNRPDVRFEHRIHEQILPSLRRAGLTVVLSDLYVTHQNYDRSVEGQQRKRRRDFRLLELDLRDRPDHPFVLFNLGMTHLLATREYEVAAHYLRRCLRGSDWRDSIVRKAYAFLTTAHMEQEEWAAALDANGEGRRRYPDDAELLFQAGRIYAQLQRWDEAQRALERLIGGKDDPHFRSVDVGLRTYRGRHEMALLLRRRGSGARSAQLLRDVAADYPDYLPAQLDLVETLCLAGEHEEARRRLAQIPSAPAIEGHLAHLRGLLDAGSRA